MLNVAIHVRFDHFDYKLKEGELKNRNAIRILQINDYPAELINEAIEISQMLDGVKVLDSLFVFGYEVLIKNNYISFLRAIF